MSKIKTPEIPTPTPAPADDSLRPGERLLTTSEAAKQLGVHGDTLKRLMNNGRLRYIKLGRVSRISPGAIRKFIASSEARRD